MAMTKSALEILFDRLHHNQHQYVPRILQDAVDEYRSLTGELDRDDRRKVSYISSLLDYCRAERWVFARNQLEPAEQEYYRYFFSKKTPEKLNKRPPIMLYSDLPPDSRRGGERGGDRLDSKRDRQRPSSYTNVQQKQPVTERPSSEHAPQTTRKTSRVTDLSDLNTAQKIANKFREIYITEWVGALDELQQLRIYEKNAITCLLRIVLDAYRLCVMEADTQITKLEDAAFTILMEGSYNHPGHVKGRNALLLEYRRGIAHICLERLQESFRRRYLPEIIRSVGVYQNIRTHGSVMLYANQCVAICWAMAVLDPQVYVVDERDNVGLFSAELYNQYNKFGQGVAYYVWPPLRTHKGGKLLTKGVAEGR